MEKFTTLTGVAAPLPMINVDTDMIIPEQFLKTIKRTGLGKNLFDDAALSTPTAARSPISCSTSRPIARRKILVAGANFGCGSSREHAPWALLDFGIRCVDRAELRRHLLQQLLQERHPADRAAAGDVRPADGRRQAAAPMRVSPSISRSRTITRPDGATRQVRHRPVPQALPAQRPRRYRPDAAEGDEIDRVRGAAPRRAALAVASATATDRACRTRTLLILPGDGIGPEVMRQVAPRHRLVRRKRRVVASTSARAWSAARATTRTARRSPTRRMARRAWTPTRCCSARSAARNGTTLPFDRAARARPAAPAQGHGAVRQPAPGAWCSTRWPTPRRLKPEIVARPRHHDRARAHRRRLFRRAARHRDPARRRAPRRQHPGLHDARDRARRAASPSSWRASARNKVCSVEKANVMESRRAVARGGAASCTTPNIQDVELDAHVRRQLRHAAGAQPQAVRRHRHRQPVRRHPVGLRGDADRLARHAALGLAGRRRRDRPAHGALRAGARLGARHRRQGHRQPARHAPLASR